MTAARRRRLLRRWIAQPGTSRWFGSVQCSDC
ncbi:hypothetical protein [Rhodopseudomonas sp.]